MNPSTDILQPVDPEVGQFTTHLAKLYSNNILCVLLHLPMTRAEGIASLLRDVFNHAPGGCYLQL